MKGEITMIYTSLSIDVKKFSAVKSMAQGLQPKKNNLVRAVGKFDPATKTLSSITPAKTWSVTFNEDTILPNTSELLLMEGYLDLDTEANNTLRVIPTVLFRFPKKSVVRDALHYIAKKDITFSQKCATSFSMCVTGKVTEIRKPNLDITFDDGKTLKLKCTLPNKFVLGEEVTLKVTSICQGELIAIDKMNCCNEVFNDFYYNNVLGGVLIEQ